MATRYVNTGSTAGGDGTTNATTGTNRAFASRSEAEAARPATMTEPWNIICGGSAADTTELNISGVTGSSTNRTTFTTASADRHENKYDTSKPRLEVSGTGQAIYIQEDHVDIRFHQVKQHRDSWNSRYVIRCDGDQSDVEIEACIAKQTGSSSSGDTIALFLGSTTPKAFKVWNTLIDGQGSGIYGGTGASPNVVLYDSTIVNCSVKAVDSWGSRVKAIGLRAYNCGGTFPTFASGSSNNTDSDTDSFADASGGDFRLSSSDTVSKDNGYDLSSDGDIAITTDGQGDTRSTTSPDQGFDEYAAASSGSGDTVVIGVSDAEAIGAGSRSTAAAVTAAAQASPAGTPARSVPVVVPAVSAASVAGASARSNGCLVSAASAVQVSATSARSGATVVSAASAVVVTGLAVENASGTGATAVTAVSDANVYGAGWRPGLPIVEGLAGAVDIGRPARSVVPAVVAVAGATVAGTAAEAKAGVSNVAALAAVSVFGASTRSGAVVVGDVAAVIINGLPVRFGIADVSAVSAVMAAGLKGSAGMGVIIDPTIESLTVRRTIESLTIQRTIHSI